MAEIGRNKKVKISASSCQLKNGCPGYKNSKDGCIMGAFTLRIPPLSETEKTEI
jgi:hypothetical protein